MPHSSASPSTACSRGDLEDAKAEHLTLRQQLEQAKAKEEELYDQLKRKDQWYEAERQKREDARSEVTELQKTLQKKEKDLEKEFSKNVKLSRQLSELDNQVSLLDLDNKQKTDRILELERQVKEYSAQMLEQKRTIAAFERKEQDEGQQQGADSHRCEVVKKLHFEPLLPFQRNEPSSGEVSRDKRQGNVNPNR